MENKTVLTLLIETLETQISSNGKRAFELVDKTTLATIKLAKSFLPKEKEQITSAFTNGINHYGGDDPDSVDEKFADLYYRQNYGK